MLKRIKPLWEVLQEPRTWTTANVGAGMMLILAVKQSEPAAEAFAIGWALSAITASLPSIFSTYWDFRSPRQIRADRSLAYIEGWQHHRASLENYIERAQAGEKVDASEASEAAYTVFLEGLDRVESGRHLPNL